MLVCNVIDLNTNIDAQFQLKYLRYKEKILVDSIRQHNLLIVLKLVRGMFILNFTRTMQAITTLKAEVVIRLGNIQFQVLYQKITRLQYFIIFK